MKLLTDNDVQKLKLLDKIFSVVSLENLQQIFTADLVVDKLRGNVDDRGILVDLYYDNSRMLGDIALLHTKLFELESKMNALSLVQSDLHTVIRTVNTLMPNQVVINEFQNLKSRNGIYP